MPFAAPLNWPLTLVWATTSLTLLVSLIWWIQLPSMPTLSPSSSQTTLLWNW